MKINIEKPTYLYKKPFVLCKKECKDSIELAEAILENWDIAVSVFRRGDMEGFWRKYTNLDEAEKAGKDSDFEKIYLAMWDFKKKSNEDILFLKAFHMIEPAVKEMPYPLPWENEVRLLTEKDLAEIFERMYIWSNHWQWIVKEDYNLRWEQAYDKDYEKVLWLCQMIEEGAFCDWFPVSKLDTEYKNEIERYQQFVLSVRDKKELESSEWKYKSSWEDCIRKYEKWFQGEREFVLETYHYEPQEGKLRGKKICEKTSYYKLDEFLKAQKLETKSEAGISLLLRSLLKPKSEEERTEWENWLLELNEMDLYEKIQSWKKSWEKIGWLERDPSTFHKTEVISIGYKDKSIVKIDRDHLNEKVKELEEQKHSKQCKEAIAVYRNLFELLSQKEPVSWEKSEIKQQLEKAVREWEKFEKVQYEDDKEKLMILNAMLDGTIFQLWDYSFVYPITYLRFYSGILQVRKELKMDMKRYLLLAGCTLSMENYQQETEELIAFLRRKREITSEQVRQLIKDIHEFILVDKKLLISKDELVPHYLMLMVRIKKENGYQTIASEKWETFFKDEEFLKQIYAAEEAYKPVKEKPPVKAESVIETEKPEVKAESVIETGKPPVKKLSLWEYQTHVAEIALKVKTGEVDLKAIVLRMLENPKIYLKKKDETYIHYSKEEQHYYLVTFAKKRIVKRKKVMKLFENQLFTEIDVKELYEGNKNDKDEYRLERLFFSETAFYRAALPLFLENRKV